MNGTRLPIAVACLLWAAPVAAQEAVTMPGGDTTLWFGLGLSAGASETGAAMRVGVDRLLTRTLHLEVSGAYLDRGLRAESWSAYAGARVDLADAGETVVPYLAAGGGVYRTSFEQVGVGMTDQAGFACMGAGRDQACYGSMPRFYAQRMRADAAPRRWPDRRSFTDPMGVAGVGVRWDVTPQVFVIPDARAFLVFGDGDSDVVGMFTLNVGYRF